MENAMSASDSALEQLLIAWNGGQHDEIERLLPPVYAELRRMARKHLRYERPDHTLQATALVHETYLRIAANARAFQNREHFFGVAAQVMRQVLVDHARARRAAKRGGPAVHLVPLDDIAVAVDGGPSSVEQLHEALEALVALDARQAELVQLRYFAGLTNQEAATAVGVSVPTVERELRTARVWIKHFLRKRR
jgi:RNA polymerase sigma factor (TIGR02999 family)